MRGILHQVLSRGAGKTALTLPGFIGKPPDIADLARVRVCRVLVLVSAEGTDFTGCE